MVGFRSSLLTASLLAIAAFTAPAYAQQARSFVSGLGNDANAPNCLRTVPCRTFQVAHDSTLANGEITVLDPGSYGAVTINRNISIINDGVGEAGTLVSGGGTGITINAPNAAVSLRGLTIKGIGFGGGNGIVFVTGKSLTIENCAVRNLTRNGQDLTTGHGIVYNPQQSFPGKTNLVVSHTFVADNEGHGISIVPRGDGFAHVEINRSEVYNNGGHGIVAHISALWGGRIDAVVESTVSAGNVFSGFATSEAGGPGDARMLVVRSVSANNGVGFSSSTHSFMHVGRSIVKGNTQTWPDSTIASFKDNYCIDNLDGCPGSSFQDSGQ